MWQVQWRHQVHDWKEALHLLADFPEIHQPSHPPGHFSFLPGDSNPTRTHLFSLGPRLREFTKTTSYKNLWNLKKKEKEKKINIISQNQLFLFYVILPHLMKKFHFYLHNIKNKQTDFYCQTAGQVYRLFWWIEAGSWQLLQSCNNSFNSPVGFKMFRKPRPVGFINSGWNRGVGLACWVGGLSQTNYISIQPNFMAPTEVHRLMMTSWKPPILMISWLSRWHMAFLNVLLL